MGGRLDATNIVTPIISVITDISLDHTEWLGSSISEITREKAGILRQGGTLIMLPQEQEANRTLEEIALQLGVRMVSAKDYLAVAENIGGDFYSVEVKGKAIKVASPLKGDHQRRNIALAIAAAIELGSVNQIEVSAEAIQEGIRRTCWPGRLEKIRSEKLEWILDVAHNPAGAEALRLALSGILEEGRRRILIFSCLKDKPIEELSRILFPIFDEVILAPIHSSRAAEMGSLKAAGIEVGSAVTSVESVREALLLAKERAQGGVVVISGSVYLVGEARPLLLGGGIK
jgi:dihydrofolate synthase/folylpolyglutamate synthase